MNGKFVLTFLLICGHLAAYAQPKKTPAFSQTYVALHGDYADPSIVRVGDTFYMTHSSYAYYPGLLIWKSTDLKTWTPVTRALHTMVGNVWAPELMHYKGKFYIYFPTDKGGNYVITADKPEGPWSQPVQIDVQGIDPGHIATPEGKRYLYVNAGRVTELAADGLSKAGDIQQVYDGWKYPLSWGVECFCLESPKLIFHAGYYYLTSAQGGTAGPATSHMAVVARSKSPLGPWENSPYNPLIHTWSPAEPWVSKGHGTLFSDSQNNWYVVYHGYEKGHLPMGRSTLIEPLTWTKDGWVKSAISKPAFQINTQPLIASDDFNAKDLKLQWSFSNLTALSDYSLKDGTLTLQATADKMRVAQLIPHHPSYEVSIQVQPDAGTETGLILYYDDKQYAGISLKEGKISGLSHGKKYFLPEIDASGYQYLKLKLIAYTLYLSYSMDGKTWQPYEAAFDMSGYHTQMLGGFSFLKIGIYAKGTGNVRLDNFVYQPL